MACTNKTIIIFLFLEFVFSEKYHPKSYMLMIRLLNSTFSKKESLTKLLDKLFLKNKQEFNLINYTKNEARKENNIKINFQLLTRFSILSYKSLEYLWIKNFIKLSIINELTDFFDISYDLVVSCNNPNLHINSRSKFCSK